MRQPVTEMGEAAIDILVDPAYRAGDRTAAAFRCRLDYTMIVRESNAAP